MGPERGSEKVYCWTESDRKSYRIHSKCNKLNSLLSYSQERGQKKRRENNFKKERIKVKELIGTGGS